jgi:hypothetical protein
MAFNLSALRSARANPKPPMIVLYGPPKIGKTTFAACMPNPVILPTEDGLSSLASLPFDVPAFPVAKTFEEVQQALTSLYAEPHDFQTLCLDSLDWLEPIVWAETCRRNNWKDIEAPGYGKGYSAAIDVWLQLLNGLPAFLAGNRYALPPELPFNWPALAEAMAPKQPVSAPVADEQAA